MMNKLKLGTLNTLMISGLFERMLSPGARSQKSEAGSNF